MKRRKVEFHYVLFQVPTFFPHLHVTNLLDPEMMVSVFYFFPQFLWIKCLTRNVHGYVWVCPCICVQLSSVTLSNRVMLLGLKLAVLGACLCHGPRGSPCSCAKMAASAQKRILQLKQEVSYCQNSKSFGFVSLLIVEQIEVSSIITFILLLIGDGS